MQVVKKEFCCRLVWCQFYENRFKASIYCTFEAADIDSFPLGIFWITFVFQMVVSMYRMFHNDAIQTHIEPSFEKHTCKICISYNRSYKKHFVTIYFQLRIKADLPPYIYLIIFYGFRHTQIVCIGSQTQLLVASMHSKEGHLKRIIESEMTRVEW